MSFPGIFEVLADDHSEARLASRKALSLAEVRVDTRIGQFLSAANSGAEFDARFTLVQDEFENIIKGASAEAGHDNPQAIMQAIHGSYRATAGKPPWLKDDDDDDADDADDEKSDDDGDDDDKKDKKSSFLAESASFTRQHYNAVAAAIKSAPVENHEELANHFADHLENTNENFNRDRFIKASTPESKESKVAFPNEQGQPWPWEEQHEPVPVGEDYPQGDVPVTHTVELTPHYPNLLKFLQNAQGTGSDTPEIRKSVEEIERYLDSIGYSEHRAPKPYDENQGPQGGRMGKRRWAADGNTDLGGPEPTMDKARWTPQSVKPLDTDGDSPNKTKQIDATEPFEKKNDGALSDIGEDKTKKEDLPTAEGMDDAGFATGGEDKGPSTKTFGDKGQTKPVKSESLEDAS